MGRTLRISFGRLALASVWLLGCALPLAWSQDPTGPIDDPVENLRLALVESDRLETLPLPKSPNFDKVVEHNNIVKEFRRKTLSDKVAALKSLADLRRALLLKEWREDGIQADELRQIDLDQRKQLAGQFKKAVTWNVQNGGRDQRLVVASMIADMPPTLRAPGFDEFTGLTSIFLPEILELTNDKDVGVRQQALVALSVLHAAPDKVAGVYRKVLQEEANPKFKLLAAQGLRTMMEVVITMRQPSKGAQRVKVTREDLLRTVQEVVPACLIGLKDPDWLVRATCIEGIQQAGHGLESLIDSFKKKDEQQPPRGRKLSGREIDQLLKEYEEIRVQLREVDPYFDLLKKTVPDLAASLGSDQLQVRLSAIATLGTIAKVRLMRRNRLIVVPLPRVHKEKLIVLDDPLGEFLQKWMPQAMNLRGDQNVVVRQKFYEFLELLDVDAVFALPALIDGLDDPDPVAKLIVARIWKLLVQPPPMLSDDHKKAGVPGLAKMLSHPDMMVKREAAKALEWMGPLAGAGKRQILQSLRTSDVDSRLMIYPVVGRLSPQDSVDFVPDLIKGLAHEDWHLREGAAKTLGRIGPTANQAVPALRRLIGDPVEEVRQAARDALLGILPNPK